MKHKLVSKYTHARGRLVPNTKKRFVVFDSVCVAKCKALLMLVLNTLLFRIGDKKPPVIIIIVTVVIAVLLIATIIIITILIGIMRQRKKRQKKFALPTPEPIYDDQQQENVTLPITQQLPGDQAEERC